MKKSGRPAHPTTRCSQTGPRSSARHRSTVSSRSISAGVRAGACGAPGEIAAIADDKAAPDFDNTVAALERSGRALARVSSVFYVSAGAHTSEAIQAIERAMAAQARPALERDPSQRGAVRPARRTSQIREPRTHREQRACWSATTRCSARGAGSTPPRRSG